MDAELVRGDTGDFTACPFFTNGTDREYLLENGETVYFTLRKLKDKEIIFQKEDSNFVDNTFTIRIAPEDTENLEPGNYLYDLKVVRSDGSVDTLLPNGKESAYFTIKKGVK